MSVSTVLLMLLTTTLTTYLLQTWLPWAAIVNTTTLCDLQQTRHNFIIALGSYTTKLLATEEQLEKLLLAYSFFHRLLEDEGELYAKERVNALITEIEATFEVAHTLTGHIEILTERIRNLDNTHRSLRNVSQEQGASPWASN